MAGRRIDRRTFLKQAGVGAVGLAASGEAFNTGHDVGLARATPDVAPAAELRVSDPAEVRVLQFTDLHFFCVDKLRGRLKDLKSVEVMKRLVDRTAPQLVAVTGDLWNNDPSGRGEEFMRFGVEQCESLGVPWLFTWGNHDRMADYAVGHEAFTAAKHSLYRGGATGGNYVVRIATSTGEPAWDLICLNSVKLGLGEEQRAYLRGLAADRATQAGPAPPSFTMFHIPVRQYLDIWKSGAASGIRRESVAYHDEDGTTFPLFKDLGVRACFCGHDHVNDYAAPLEGLELVYGRATGYGGYGGVVLNKGAKLITLNTETGTHSWDTLLPDGARWHPKAGERVGQSA